MPPEHVLGALAGDTEIRRVVTGANFAQVSGRRVGQQSVMESPMKSKSTGPSLDAGEELFVPVVVAVDGVTALSAVR